MDIKFGGIVRKPLTRTRKCPAQQRIDGLPRLSLYQYAQVKALVSEYIGHSIRVVGVGMSHNLFVRLRDNTIMVQIFVPGIAHGLAGTIHSHFFIDIILCKNTDHFDDIDAVQWASYALNIVGHVKSIGNYDLVLVAVQRNDLIAVVAD